MIELSQVKNIFDSYDGINLISFRNEKNSFIVLFNFDANVSINGANFFIDYKIHLEVPKNYR